MALEIPTVLYLAEVDVSQYGKGKDKTAFKGIGVDSLAKFHRRARLLAGKDTAAYLTTPIALPHADTEIFFDIEVDPMRDICYLHGFMERSKNGSEKFIYFITEDVSKSEEERAFRAAWQYLQNVQPAVVFYYSKYERTIWRRLQMKYPAVCTREEVDALFEKMVDLYFDVVKKHTEWPTNDHSIKTLAKHLGFNWRDTHPSGAASIEWFDRWVKTGDPAIRQRILDYNEDDCRATRVLLDGIRSIGSPQAIAS